MRNVSKLECFVFFSTSSVLRFWQARQQVNSIIFWCKRGTTSKAHVRGNPPRQIFVAGRRIPKLKWGHFWKILREVKVTTNLPEMNFNYWGSNCNSSDLHLPTHATWKHTWKVINCKKRWQQGFRVPFPQQFIESTWLFQIEVLAASQGISDQLSSRAPPFSWSIGWSSMKPCFDDDETCIGLSPKNLAMYSNASSYATVMCS